MTASGRNAWTAGIRWLAAFPTREIFRLLSGISIGIDNIFHAQGIIRAEIEPIVLDLHSFVPGRCSKAKNEAGVGTYRRADQIIPFSHDAELGPILVFPVFMQQVGHAAS